jgi:hypothetical protein
MIQQVGGIAKNRDSPGITQIVLRKTTAEKGESRP